MRGLLAGLLLLASTPSLSWVLDSPLAHSTVTEEEGWVGGIGQTLVVFEPSEHFCQFNMMYRPCRVFSTQNMMPNGHPLFVAALAM